MAYTSRAQKKFSENGINMEGSIDGIVAALAAGEAIGNSMTDPNYTDAVMDTAFARVDEAFNLEAAAYASTGAISHMYEWGTVGVNKGRTNVKLSPMSPNSRLWHTFTEGSGLDRIVWFAYRPSVANVPKPTKRDTGMSTDVINKMRDHVFRWKAEVLEEGQTVTIRPKQAKFLLLPAYESQRPYMRNHDKKRGYSLTKGPVSVKPGRKIKGNFTNFWYGWWFDHGIDRVTDTFNVLVIQDFTPEVQKPRTSKTLRPIGTMDMRADIKKKASKIQRDVVRKARTRKVADVSDNV